MRSIAHVLLGVSLLSLIVYLLAFVRLMTQSHHRGLARTAGCRVAAACLYLVVAMLAVAGHPGGPAISLGVFVAIQLMWQVNAVADVLLTRQENRIGRRLSHGALDYRVRPKPRHRRK